MNNWYLVKTPNNNREQYLNIDLIVSICTLTYNNRSTTKIVMVNGDEISVNKDASEIIKEIKGQNSKKTLFESD